MARGHAEGDVLVLVGTMKGAFIASSDASRRRWRIDGPHFPGESVYAMAYDERGGRRRIYAATRNAAWGASLRMSDDFGRTWTSPERQTVRFPDGSGLALAQIWQICLGPDDEPDTLWVGVEPTALFESRDAGATWTANAALLTHEHRPRWSPGAGGQCLHTIVPDRANRQRMLIAMSTGGVYRTDDGGASWQARNVGVRAEFLPDKYPEFGQCVHKVTQHPQRPSRLFLQNHWGLYRSDDWGDHWSDMANGVPSDFGFAMDVHPADPDTVYIVPLQSDQFRVVPGAKMRVYRTRDAGESWEGLSNGLPQRRAYESVLRDALSTDSHDPAGVYVGTRSGKLYGSADSGESWRAISTTLTPICCVRGAVVGGATARAAAAGAVA